jgi:hypothetical protein
MSQDFSLQNQALNALLFLYREAMEKPIGYINDVVREEARTFARRTHPSGGQSAVRVS